MSQGKRMSVLIVGAGVAGLTTAYWLRRAGHEVRVIERAAWPRREGFMIDFYGPGYAVAEEMGMISQLEKIHREIATWSFETMTGDPLFSVPYVEVRRRLFGGRHFNFLRSDLVHLLLSRVCDHVEVRCGVSLEMLRPCGPYVAASLTDGSSMVCDLVVGAGGVHSRTRRLWLGGGDSWERYLGLDAAAFSIDDAAIRSAVGDELRTLTGPGRQVTVYPAGGDRVGLFFVHERDRTLEDRSASGIANELRSVYDGFGGVVPALLSAIGRARDLYYDAVAQVILPQWSLGRVVLVGDACQCVSPLGGQGASLAMAGARSLVKELVAAEGEVGSALSSYERRMRPAVSRAQEAGRRMARWIAPRSKVKMLARDLALRASVWPIASSVMRHALGTAENTG
jgi:2-polyprenyl-6-methoxyphenol hydroxylase-like FAD-dependent oxidoreductase